MSDYPEVRPNVVAALVGISDPGNLTDEERAALADATEREVREAGTAHALAVLEHFTDAGLLRRSTVLDLDVRTFLAMTAAWGELMHWWPQPVLRDRPLGDVLKVIPVEVAERVLQHLRWGGLLPEEPPDLEAPDE